MIASFMITFRETLEVALVLGIIWSYLIKSHNRSLLPTLVKGCVAGIVVSILGAYLFQILAGGFVGKAEQIFEGTTMIIAGLLLTTMILWMMFKNSAHELESSVATAIEVEDSSKIALFLLVFFSVLREGIETVLFLSSVSIVSDTSLLSGAILGIVLASFLGWCFFQGSLKLKLKTVFNLSSALLILFASGLFAHGVHEFQEAGILPVMIEHVWDINPVIIDGVYSVMHEQGSIGSIFKSLFGYNGNPTLLEVVTYMFYLMTACGIWLLATKKRCSRC
ncbi:FTR1 family iron permease [Geopsychrobacter electrodiphilus]|uniref:FTR1 family iron permease n=1 Tax=Geopsychrobacter electrodiphilus TaxID=225196 RepID=UPI00036BDC91|nr:FTR1 family protein [Geopsychrobacter electrodiphilus]